ncbi:MAG TPA: glutamate ABC transporter substrate-binding protein [Natronosporangium sp.]|nr:glutamate ABC transporter substrate-binding protein [Natronosporangium sp.]
MKFRRLAALATVGVLALTACGGNGDDNNGGNGDASQFPEGSTMAALAEAGVLRVGTKFDQPGFGQVNLDGVPEGFDVEIAKIIAEELGITEDNIEWVEAPSAVREELLERNEVDIVIATYTINSERKERVDFAGPYYMAGQHIMVMADNDEITGPESFESGEHTVCSVQGSTPSEQIRPYLANEAEQLVLFDVYTRCVDALKAGDVDAVTTDNVILLGFIAEEPGTFKLVESGTFTEEPYGIGVQKGKDDFRSWINDLLEEIYEDGRYAAAWERTAGQFDPQLPEPPAVDRY